MSRFRTTEISDPRFESNQLRFITVKSQNLRGRGDICLFVPRGAHRDLPLVILLHGVYGSCWSWSHQAGVHLQLEKAIANGKLPPMILVMPSDGLWGDGSAYLPHNHRDFESWIVDDVPNAVIENIPAASKDSPLFIAGLSMGGFGALRIGAKFGSRFTAFAAHSSITKLEQMKSFVEEDVSQYRQEDQTEMEVFQMILRNREHLPPLRFDCGKEDDLFQENLLLHQCLEEQGIPHEFLAHPGAHHWPYWENHIGETLRFFADQL